MKSFLFSFAALAIFSLAACSKDDTPQPEEQELITTLHFIVTPQAGGAEETFRYKVENGFGSTSPGSLQIDTLTLRANTVYNARLRVLNEAVSPAEDLTEEITGEKDAHLFLYTANPATGAGSLAIGGGNTDNQGRPFNQIVLLSTGASGQGTLTVTLLHNALDKSAATPAAAGGETDLEAVFPVQIIN